MEIMAPSVINGSCSVEMCASAFVIGFILWVIIRRLLSFFTHNYPPAVGGLPLIGNLHQLKEKKPHITFLRWAHKYGPIYTIKTGTSTVVVLNSAQLAKEAMVNKFSSISTRKLSNALKILTGDKSMVAMADYGEEHKQMKKFVLTSLLGTNALKQIRSHRDLMIENMMKSLHEEVQASQGGAVNFRKVFQSELFSLALREAIGDDVDTVYVEELGCKISKSEMFKILVEDPMTGAIEVDWRDFFPYLRWIPNKTMETKIGEMDRRRSALMKALIEQQKKLISEGKGCNSYLRFLLREGKSLTEKQVMMLVWEIVIEASDTTMVTTEWAMFELAKNPNYQDLLYQEIQSVCCNGIIKEEDLPQLPYLNAIFHETLRKYSPAPVIPLRYVHEDCQIGGYNIPKGTQIAVNIYGCNHNKNDWEDPDSWKPERFLNGNYKPADLQKTMAFGSGKRVCAGSLQAMLIACTSIGRLVQEFQWKLCDGEEENVATIMLTTQKLHPMKAILTPRN